MAAGVRAACQVALPLSLARAGGVSAARCLGLAAGGIAILVLWPAKGCAAAGKATACLAHGGHLLILHLDESRSGTATTLDGRRRLLVGGGVEADEENQVRRQDADTGDGGKFLAST